MTDAERDELRSLQRRAYGTDDAALTAGEQRRLNELLARRNADRVSDAPTPDPLNTDVSSASEGDATQTRPGRERSTRDAPDTEDADSTLTARPLMPDGDAPAPPPRRRGIALAATAIAAALALGGFIGHTVGTSVARAPAATAPATDPPVPVPERIRAQLPDVMTVLSREDLDPDTLRFLGEVDGEAVWGVSAADGRLCAIYSRGLVSACASVGATVQAFLDPPTNSVVAVRTRTDGEITMRLEAGEGGNLSRPAAALAERLRISPDALSPLTKIGAVRVWGLQTDRRCAVVATATANPDSLLAAAPICVSGDEELRLISAADGLYDAQTGVPFPSGIDAADQDVWFRWPTDGALSISLRPAQ